MLSFTYRLWLLLHCSDRVVTLENIVYKAWFSKPKSLLSAPLQQTTPCLQH